MQACASATSAINAGTGFAQHRFQFRPALIYRVEFGRVRWADTSQTRDHPQAWQAMSGQLEATDRLMEQYAAYDAEPSAVWHEQLEKLWDWRYNARAMKCHRAKRIKADQQVTAAR